MLGSTSDAESRELLNAAYDAGIRHFDVAPMYGFGRSERLLFDALGRRLQDVTITTKYGMSPPSHSSWKAPLHRLARTALLSFPSLKKRLQQAAAPGEQPLSLMTAVEAEASIRRSRHELGNARIDLFLLHEATPERLQDEALHDALERFKRQDLIGEFGVGSRSDRIVACLKQSPEYCRVVQFEWSVFTPRVAELQVQPRIQHGSLGSTPASFWPWLQDDEAKLNHWCEETNLDLREPGMINRLLFKASLVQNPDNIVLFSTRKLGNIYENLRTAEDAKLIAPARRFYELVQEDFVPGIRA